MAACEQRLFDSGMPVAALMEKVGLAMAAWLLARRDLLRQWRSIRRRLRSSL